MREDDLEVGKKYALRLPDGPCDPFSKVTYVGLIRARQYKIRYEDGEFQGLEEWIPRRLVVCPWGERKALLRDEERAARLASADNEIWDDVTEVVISHVMDASGEYGSDHHLTPSEMRAHSLEQGELADDAQERDRPLWSTGRKG